MPNWKKVIVSGSNASLNSLIVDNGITGSLFGTASFAVTSSYAISASQAITSSFITASNVFGPYGSNSVISASFAQTSSYAINMVVSGSINNVDYIDFNNTLSPLPATVEGRIFWDEDNGTLSLGMHGGQVLQQIGLEEYFYIKNQTGVTLTNGSVIRSAGTLGNSGRILGDYMIADGTIPYYYTLGIATEDIIDGEDGYVTQFGAVRGIDTTGTSVGETWSDGDILWVSTTVLGGLTKFEPDAPNLKIQMAIVIKAGANGILFVRPELNSFLTDLHNVNDFSTTSSYGDLLIKSGSTWINSKQLTGSYGLTGSLTVINGGITSSLQGTSSFAIQAVTSSYADSFTVKNNAIISGSLTILQNLTVFGSASITYVSESTLNIGTNLITVNSNTPAVRFGGLAVIDSGSSPQVSGSWLFDSIQNRWIFLHQQTAVSALTSSIGIMGPETYNNQGNETQITLNRLTKGYSGASGEHIGDSQISDNGTTVSIPGILVVTGSITGSLFGTASFATAATTASYVLNAVSASFATSASFARNAVSSSYPIAVTGSNLYSTDPAAYIPDTNTNNSVFLGFNAGQFIGFSDNIMIGYNAGNGGYSLYNSNFLGNSAGGGASDAYNSNFLGYEAGSSAFSSNFSNFLGYQAGYSAFSANDSNFLGQSAGAEATNAYSSNFLGYQAGLSASYANYSNFLGPSAGAEATNANSSNFLGYQAGYAAFGADNSNFFGFNAGADASNAVNSNFLGPLAGYLAVSAYDSNFFGYEAGTNATNASSSNFLGYQAGTNATNANSSNFIGYNAGGIDNSFAYATDANNSNFLGTNAGAGATYAYNSNFLGSSAGYGAISANDSNFFGYEAGYGSIASSSNFLGYRAGASANGSNSNFIGYYAGALAYNANDSNFIGTNAGDFAQYAQYSTLIGYRVAANVNFTNGIGSNNIIIGTNITLEDDRINSINIGGLIFGSDSYSTTTGNPFSGSANGKVGINQPNPEYDFDVSGSGNYTNGLTVSGSTTITGSLGVGTTGSAVVGRIDASNDVVAFATSDIHLKENLKPIANALYKLDHIQGYTFDWKQDEKLVSQHGFTGRDIGVIAQEIEEILPEVVITRDSGYKAVKYEKIVPFLIQCIKELKDEIEELKGAKTPKKTRKPRAKNKPE